MTLTICGICICIEKRHVVIVVLDLKGGVEVEKVQSDIQYNHPCCQGSVPCIKRSCCHSPEFLVMSFQIKETCNFLPG